ncbi:MAG: amidohydrolase [Chloroflexi bacterium]|nr:amidohydrolase [Chloroflexota bacterium]
MIPAPRPYGAISVVNGKPLDLPEFKPFWALAEEMDVAIYIHPSYVRGRSYETDFDLPHVAGWPFETSLTLSRLVFSGVLERYPGLKPVAV